MITLLYILYIFTVTLTVATFCYGEAHDMSPEWPYFVTMGQWFLMCLNGKEMFMCGPAFDNLDNKAIGVLWENHCLSSQKLYSFKLSFEQQQEIV